MIHSSCCFPGSTVLTDPHMPIDFAPSGFSLGAKAGKELFGESWLSAIHMPTKPDGNFGGLRKGTSWATGHTP